MVLETAEVVGDDVDRSLGRGHEFLCARHLGGAFFRGGGSVFRRVKEELDPDELLHLEGELEAPFVGAVGEVGNFCGNFFGVAIALGSVNRSLGGVVSNPKLASRLWGRLTLAGHFWITWTSSGVAVCA